MTAVGIQVGEFSESPNPPFDHQPRVRTAVKNWSASFGLAGTLILHGIGVSALLVGAAVHKVKPPELDGGGGSAPPAAELVLLQLPSKARGDEDPLASLRTQLTTKTIPRLKIDLVPAPDLGIDLGGQVSAISAADAGDSALRALMFGRYTGQISARIERAWMRPRSPVVEAGIDNKAYETAADTFRCEVQIRQDDKGDVQEVLLLDCNGTDAWRHSLVVAINQSSPLPAPPIPGVFMRALTMTFEANLSRDGSEPDRRTASE